MDHRIREIDPENRQDTAVITRLHLELLWWGPLALLGETILRDFCYTVLVREGLMRAALYEVGRHPAGFVVYTDRSITFHRSAISRHFGYVTYLTALSLLRNPRVIFWLMRAIRLMVSRRKEHKESRDPLAEILAIGVKPEYRNAGFVRRTGLQISRELVAHAVLYFRRIGLSRMRMIVDADNKPALLFYHGLGGRLEPCKQGGVSAYCVWLDI
jgi:ribosomal protein S18 acetylase RimI-like enzyme